MLSRNFGASLTRTMQSVALLLVAVIAQMPNADAANTRVPANSRLPRTTTAHYGYTVAGRSSLPPTVMDSFVANAVQAKRGDAIYGDESQGENPPPFMGFTADHRINAGITGAQDAGLTTGHGSRLPDAWGRDEFIGGQEWSQGGPNNGAYNIVSTPDVQATPDGQVTPDQQMLASYDVPNVNPNVAPAVAPSYRKAYSTATAAGAYFASANSAVSLADSGF
jgi:hypothetical protein